MKNSRNAGRRAELTTGEVEELKSRWEAGESVSELAREKGISRQALYRHFKNHEYVPARIEYYTNDVLSTLIEADFRRERVHIVNYVSELSKRAFGYEENPDWENFLSFLEDWSFKVMGASEKDTYLLREDGQGYSLKDLEGTYGDNGLHYIPDGEGKVPVFRFAKKNLILYRSDTDGYQLKALSADRRYFVKAQAVMAGIRLRDWAVEIAACRLCQQLGIACMEQKHCRLAYGGKVYDAVYAPNFELDGYTFYSFESLLERANISSGQDEFIRMDAIEKLKWCADWLARIGNIAYEMTQKYMLDLAVLDCLIGNVDRHTRNFGLFYHSGSGQFEIPPVFDNGMGLFEHDYYRDQYKNFDEAMRSVYVSPYGEDPFELLEILKQELDLKSLYPDSIELDYGEEIRTPFALEYMERMKMLWQR